MKCAGAKSRNYKLVKKDNSHSGCSRASMSFSNFLDQLLCMDLGGGGGIPHEKLKGSAAAEEVHSYTKECSVSRQ